MKDLRPENGMVKANGAVINAMFRQKKRTIVTSNAGNGITKQQNGHVMPENSGKNR